MVTSSHYIIAALYNRSAAILKIFTEAARCRQKRTNILICGPGQASSHAKHTKPVPPQKFLCPKKFVLNV